MTIRGHGVVMVAVVLALAPALSRAANFPPPTTPYLPYDRDSNREPSRYYVLSVLGSDGEMSFDVVSNIDYKGKLRDYKEEYREAAIEWLKARRAARKKKEPFDDKKPVGPRFLRKCRRTFGDAEDAEKYAQKLLEQWEEALRKRQAEKQPKKKGDDLADDPDDRDGNARKKGKKADADEKDKPKPDGKEEDKAAKEDKDIEEDAKEDKDKGKDGEDKLKGRFRFPRT